MLNESCCEEDSVDIVEEDAGVVDVEDDDKELLEYDIEDNGVEYPLE